MGLWDEGVRVRVDGPGCRFGVSGLRFFKFRSEGSRVYGFGLGGCWVFGGDSR